MNQGSSIMGNNDRLGAGDQHLCPNELQPKPLNDKSTYRLFPTANQQAQVSPKTLQQQTLQRSTSFKKRRSVSLDDSARPHGVARMPFSRPGDAPVPRLQAVPANRMKMTKPDTQDRTRVSHGPLSRNEPDGLTAQAPKVLAYKPRVSEDGGHGRSSSAPDHMRGELRAKKPTGLVHITSAALSSSARAIRGNGGTWYNPHDSIIGGPKREKSHGKFEKRAQLEKPLPAPPKDNDPAYHNRSRSTPLSPGPHSASSAGARSDSVTELTPLVTPSSMDPNRKSYFPLSKDAQMRKLMYSPDDDAFDELARIHKRGQPSLSKAPDVPFILPSSRYQKPVDVPAISVKTESLGKDAAHAAHAGSPESTQSVPASSKNDSLARPSLPSPTFSQASIKPAALRITSPKRSASVNSTLDRRPLPLKARLKAANEIQLSRPPARSPDKKEDETAKVLSILSELTAQTDALHARYASLREDRQSILGSITQGMRETKPGPDYVNTILDQHMSLSTICSSMDICLAKLKAVSRRKDGLVQTLAGQSPSKSQLPSIEEHIFVPATTSARSTPAMSSSQKMANLPVIPQPQSAKEASKTDQSSAMQRFRAKLDIDYDTDDSDAPRRLNVKGAKAAKVLGLALQGTQEAETQSSSIYPASRPNQTSQQNLSTTSLDRDLFTRAPSPAPDRPLPARPSIRKKQRDHVPTPLPLRTAEKATVEKVSHAQQDSVGASTISSRASSPAEERGAETPLEEYPALDDAKSPGMQTVHVYFPDSLSHNASLHSSTFSEVGEDELLDYYQYLR